MEPLEYLDRLARRARGARPPVSDVRDRVMAQLRRSRQESLAPLWTMAGWLTPVAAASALFGMRIWMSLSGWLSSLYWANLFDECLTSLRGVTP